MNSLYGQGGRSPGAEFNSSRAIAASAKGPQARGGKKDIKI